MRQSPLFAEDSLPNGLASHQIDALTWLGDRPVALIADATGSGKTAVAAAAIADAFDHEGAERAVWVTEANLISQTLRELRRFLPTLRVSGWPGRPGDQIRVVSVETLTRRVDDVARWQPDVGVVDEASSVKGEGPEPAAVTRVLAGTFRRLGLTATPVELDATEAYRLLRLLGAPGLPPESVFADFMEWQELPYGETRPVGTKREAVRTVRGVFEQFVLRRGAEELGLELPALVEEIQLVQLTPPQQAAYERAGAHRSPLKQAMKREMACAFIGGRSAKAEGAVAWLMVRPDVSKAVVFAENLAHLSIVERLLDAAGIGWTRIDGSRSRVQRAAAAEAFKNDPSVRVLLGTRVLERGIDGLQHCGVMLSLGSTFNPAREEQRIGRLRRPASPHRQVRHITFSTVTAHEQGKQHTLQRRRREAAALIHGLSATHNPKEIDMALTELQVQSLLTSRRWLRQASPYGTPLEEAVSSVQDDDFLEAAVLAGHIPTWDGLELAIQANFLLVEAEARAEAERPGMGHAQMWTGMSEEYRKLAADLIAGAERLEALSEELHRSAS